MADQPDSPFDPGGDPNRPFGAPLLVWTVEGDGSVLATASTPDLPADLATVAGPATAHDRRHAGPDRGRPGRRRPCRRGPGDGLRDRRAADARGRLAARRADPPGLGVPWRGRHRPPGRVADRGRTPPSARVHRGRVARAADAALGHRGAHEPRPGAGPRCRLVPHGVPSGGPRVEAHAAAARGHALAGAIRRDRGPAQARASRPRRPRGAGRRPVRARRRDATADALGARPGRTAS